MNPLAELRRRFIDALAPLAEDAAELAQMVLPSQDPKFGDYQANCAMSLGKRLGKSPRDVAAEIVQRLEVSEICESPEIAGPGFINLRLRDDWIARSLAAAISDRQRLGIPVVDSQRTFVVDYSAPNIAKPMHVGHIRSTVIGDAIYRILRFVGHKTISDNHIGDWGTQFGMIIYGYKHFRDDAALTTRPVQELSRLYKLVNTLVDYFDTRDESLPALEKSILEQELVVATLNAEPTPTDPKEVKQLEKRRRQAADKLRQLEGERGELKNKIAAVEGDPELAMLAAKHPLIGQEVLRETALLHSGNPTNRALWEKFLPPCMEEINATYRRLNVTFDYTLGESFYQERLASVVADLVEKGLARESDGAKCVFLEGHEAPFIVQKQDGAFLYATTDLATIQYRIESWHPDAILYVVDHRQSLHFEQLFATARLWGFNSIELVHVSFGTVLGEDGRPFKTRSGSTVGLIGLLDEAVERAHAIVCANDDARPEPLLNEMDRRQVAERVGIAAIKYADLVHNRTSDYVFSYDKMLAMTGNTAAYMQYSYARVRSIFAKGDVDESAIRQSPVFLRTPQERALGVSLLQFAEALDRVSGDFRPNHLTAYLFDLASRYSDFFENCPVLKAETSELRVSRLLLCDLTARTISLGLHLLGIETVERM